ncbi:MAG: hypothetical protein NW223_23675 [Hyphomicrobiaceae bacterium]|nr:hypothetical protein [Hyphomicrobiaceae bacterium]
MRFTQDHLRGWLAADADLPLDPNETAEFKEGWHLHVGHRTTRQRWAQIGLSASAH